jgi:glycosyltransferase involved in cell wall biosynthesis
MNERRIIALLGRRDMPTDAVEEYCRYLGAALQAHGYSMELERVPWPERGWNTAIRELRDKSREWRGGWVLAQYTALAWSARGFPLRFPRILRELRNGGARVGIVFHDVEPYSGLRSIDKVRRRAQSRVMRQTLKAAVQGFFTVPLDAISWLARVPPNATFIPVGANLPFPAGAPTRVTGLEQSALSVAVFGITEGATGQQECKEIVDALRFVSGKGKALRLHAFGRGAREFESQLRNALRDARVEVCVEGVLPGEQVVEALTAADVALFVRAPISTRRGSAIAGIACGLPVIAYAGPETVPPITEAGIVLVSREEKAELGEALLRVASDADLRASLAERSRRAYQEHFAWNAIAGRFVNVLNKNG